MQNMVNFLDFKFILFALLKLFVYAKICIALNLFLNFN